MHLVVPAKECKEQDKILKNNKIIQQYLLMIKEKSNEQSILTQIIHEKGEHVCINNIREENCNQSLDVKPFLS